MARAQKTHDIARALVFGLCTAILIALEVSGFLPWRWMELSTQDLLIRYGRLSSRDPSLVFLAIDQQSTTLDPLFPEEIAASPELQSIKASGWPWSRDIYAAVIEKLSSAGAKVIAFDLLFPTPREGDEKLREAIERHRDKVVIGSTFVDSDRAAGSSAVLSPPAETVIADGTKSRNVGYVNFWADEDGVVRHTIFRTTPSEAAHKAAHAEEPEFLSLSARIAQLLGVQLPEDHDWRLLRFASGVRQGRAFQPISLYQIFVPEIWNGPQFQGGKFFRGKVVLIGPEGDWSKDQLNTPYGMMAGPELHLHSLNAAIHGEFVGDVSALTTAVWIAIAGLLAWFVAIRARTPLTRIGIPIGLTAAALLLARFFYNGTFGLPAEAMVLVGLCCAINTPSFTWFGVEFFIEWRERQRVRRTLERYVSPNLVREILDNPESYFNTLGGVRKPVAIMFTDLRGFTALTELADSHQLVMQLNEYFSEMVQHVFAEQGTLDKFIGDAIMAEWGNLHSEGPQRDVEQSVSAALKMCASLKRLNESWKQRGMPLLGMGVGINHGEAIVGNIGSSTGVQKMDPTVIGDAVNLASRLEGLSKEYGLEIILGESAGQLAAAMFHVQEVDFVKVKGRSQPLAIYTVYARKTEALDPAFSEYLKAYAEGLAAYREARFVHAKEAFEVCLQKQPANELARIFVARCEALIAAPPDAWDGVFVMKSK